MATRRGVCPLEALKVKCGPFDFLDSSCFLKRSTLQIAQTETEAWKLVDCPVEFIQWRFEIR
jgi:hypothetical protein